MEKLDRLIKYLLNELGEDYKIPSNIEEKRYLYLKLEDEYLQDNLKGKVIDINNFKGEKIFLYKGDITKLNCSAIVNPGNENGIGCFEPSHNCLDNVINTNAGMRLRLSCDEIMKKKNYKNYHLETSECIITKAFNLPCKYVIETVGPIVSKALTDKERIALKNCYLNSLELAKKSNIRTIAFPCISTGLFNFPNREAASIAYKTIKEYLDNNKDYFDKIIICTYKDIDYNYYRLNEKSN